MAATEHLHASDQLSIDNRLARHLSKDNRESSPGHDAHDLGHSVRVVRWQETAEQKSTRKLDRDAENEMIGILPRKSRRTPKLRYDSAYRDTAITQSMDYHGMSHILVRCNFLRRIAEKPLKSCRTTW